MNKTCFISEAFEGAKITQSGNVSKRGKSLNKTGMIAVDENEDMTDIDNCFFLQKKRKSVKKDRYQEQ